MTCRGSRSENPFQTKTIHTYIYMKDKNYDIAFSSHVRFTTVVYAKASSTMVKRLEEDHSA